MRNACAVVLLLAGCAPAQDSTQLLKQVLALYAELPKSTYDLELVEAREFPGHHSTTETRWRIAGSAGRYRQEDLSSGILYLFDGHAIWSYNPERNEYTKVDGLGYGGSLPSFLRQFEIPNLNSGRYLRQEPLDSASGPVLCQVFEVTVPNRNERMNHSPYTYWIDPSTRLVMKLRYTVDIQTDGKPEPSRQIVTLSLGKAQTGRPVDDDLFRFAPPEGALQVDQLMFGAKLPLTGKASPDFLLKTADGAILTGESLHGKVVLLIFSQSRESTATLMAELANRALKPDAFAAIQVMRQSKTPAKGAPALTLPIAFDPDGSLAKKFGISGDGTILINRSGTVVYAEVWENFSRLARAMQEAGAW